MKRRAHLHAHRAGIRERLAAFWVSQPPDTWPTEEAKDLSGRIAVRTSRALAALPQWLYLQLARFYQLATHTGTSIARTLACLTVLFVVLTPGAFLTFAHLQHCRRLHPCNGADYWDALRFSVGQALTLSPTDIVTTSTAGEWLAVGETLVAAFSLGYAIWVLTRNSP